MKKNIREIIEKLSAVRFVFRSEVYRFLDFTHQVQYFLLVEGF